MNESKIREVTRDWLCNKLRERDVHVILEPTILHGRGSLSSYIARRVDISSLLSTNDMIELEVKTWDIEPDVVGIIEKNGKGLVIVAECKSTGNLRVDHLSQIFLYSAVTRAHAAGIFFTGAPTDPVRTLLMNNVIRYEGYDENKNPTSYLIGLYKVDRRGRVERLYPQYEVFDL